MRTLPLFAAPLLAATLLLAGCSSTEPAPSEAMISERTDAMPAEANDTDVHFLGMMVPHHQQAIDMADVLLASDVTDPGVRDLAQRIRDGQQRENDQMNALADQWRIDADMDLHSHHIANGMVSPGVFDTYAALEGEELRTRFLELMHFHHAEVIAMTRDQVDNGGYAPLRDMAAEMIDVQTAEMAEMEQMYGGVPTP
ncbi:Uncharacterized conserved protein, DUF305 family [Corynebacterium pollutisoli]|uniref:Uncharacterized conserved protein, DUF305 family n=1 Tax=Corynebacterium pollutisoli TaxID=1610489 RepID=A0A1X7HVN0_9CORY|nr:DUF305 domain-containing protein [Corynebacterium pollutisoli]SMG05738.1 Uncharacterized conserved protein, DUF305 family [Corynebacterium pollutisoli]